MSRFGRRYSWWLIALAVFVLIGGLRVFGLLQPLENAVVDARARMLMREVRSDIVIVGIDAASLAALDEWPWPRRHHAKLLDALSRADPGSVFLDIDFSSQSNALDDALLEAALAKPRDFPVLLPIYYQNASGTDESLIIGQAAATLRASYRTRGRQRRSRAGRTHARLAQFLDRRRFTPAQRHRSSPRVARRSGRAHRLFDFAGLADVCLLCRRH